MKKINTLVISIICIVLIFLCTYSFAGEGSLRKISDQKLKIIFQDKEQTLVYNSLQQSEMAILNNQNAKYNEDGLIIGGEFQNVLDKKQKRNLAKSKFNVFEINKDSQVQIVQSTDISISFDGLDGVKTDDVSVVTIGGSKRILQNDPDLCLYNLSSSLDGSCGIIWTEKGMWKVSPNENTAKKISSQKYNGKTYDELLIDRVEITNSESSYVYWNDKPKISPNSNYIVYTSNRDNLDGSSIWLYDCVTGEENPLIVGEEQTYFSIVDWINDELFIFSESTNDKTKFYASTIMGQHYNIELEGANPDIIDVHDNMIAYTPISNLQNEIIISSINIENRIIKEIARVKIDGVLRLPSAGFSPNSKRFAFLYAPSEKPTLQHVSILDVNSNTVSSIKEKNFNDKKIIKSISSIEWVDESRLLVLAGDDKNLSTWEFRMEE